MNKILLKVLGWMCSPTDAEETTQKVHTIKNKYTSDMLKVQVKARRVNHQAEEVESISRRIFMATGGVYK